MSQEMNEIAKTIVAQLGGFSLLKLLLGTRQLVFNDRGIRFDIQGCAKINNVQIDYDAGMDLYKMKFFHLSERKASLNLVAEYDDIYADQLCDMIESETGLFLEPMRIQIAGQYASV
jgi:hypothetical protein